MYLYDFQSRVLRPSCCRCQMTNWLMLSFNWQSAEAPWLSHTTWCPKIRCPKPVNQLTEKAKPTHPSPVKVFMKDVMFLGHVCLIFTLTICSALSRSTIEAVHQRQLVIPEFNLHIGTHDIIRKEADQTLPGQRFPVFRKRHLSWVPSEAHSGKKKKKRVNLDLSTAPWNNDKIVPTLSVLGCVQLLQDSLGSVVFLGAADGGLATRQDLFEFIKQCGLKTPTDPDEVSH